MVEIDGTGIEPILDVKYFGLARNDGSLPEITDGMVQHFKHAVNVPHSVN